MAKGKRGRESSGDMVRSLGLVLIIVAVVFFFAQPPHSDAKKLRVVDSRSDVKAFSSSAPGAPVPTGLPEGWRSTVSTYDPDMGVLRVGWVTPKGEYAEYAAAGRPPAGFRTDLLGSAKSAGTEEIGGVSWERFQQGNATSLVHSFDATTVVLGTLRDTASLDELRVLALGLRP